MNINKKVSLLFVLIFILSFLFISIIVKNRIVNIENIEEKIVINNIKKVQNILNNYYEKIENISYEYSTHNLIIDIVKNRDKEKLNSFFNNKPDFMKKLNLTYFILLDKDKEPLFSKYYDLASDEELHASKELFSYLKKSDLSKLDSKNKYLTLNFEKSYLVLRKSYLIMR